MKQTGYHTIHHDTGGDGTGERLEFSAAPRIFADNFTPASGHAPATEDGEGLRFTQRRKLRGLDLEGSSPLNLRVGQHVVRVKPGQNRFFPPIPLEPGDMLQLEPVGTATSGGTHE